MEQPDIDSTAISVYVRELEFKNKELSQQYQRIQEESIDTHKFYGTTVTPEICARIHGVCALTVREYVKTGHIPKHPDSTDRKILIRTSDALTLDFRQLKKLARGN